MLVMTLKKNSLLQLNKGESLILIKGVSKKGLEVKLLSKNEYGNYNDEGLHTPNKEKFIKISESLKLIHLSGSGNQMKVGFEGEDFIVRCPKKFKYVIQKPRNLDDSFFDFDTEGY